MRVSYLHGALNVDVSYSPYNLSLVELAVLLKSKFTGLYLVLIALILLSLSSASNSTSRVNLRDCKIASQTDIQKFRFQTYLSKYFTYFFQPPATEGFKPNDELKTEISVFLTCRFKGRTIEEFSVFFNNLTIQQAQLDAEEKRARGQAVLKFIELGDEYRKSKKSGKKPSTPKERKQILDNLDSIVFVRKHYGHKTRYKFCHLLPSKVAMEFAKNPNFIKNLLLFGQFCWRIRVGTREEKIITKIDVHRNTMDGPWP